MFQKNMWINSHEGTAITTQPFLLELGTQEATQFTRRSCGQFNARSLVLSSQASLVPNLWISKGRTFA